MCESIKRCIMLVSAHTRAAARRPGCTHVQCSGGSDVHGQHRHAANRTSRARCGWRGQPPTGARRKPVRRCSHRHSNRSAPTPAPTRTPTAAAAATAARGRGCRPCWGHRAARASGVRWAGRTRVPGRLATDAHDPGVTRPHCCAQGDSPCCGGGGGGGGSGWWGGVSVGGRGPSTAVGQAARGQGGAQAAGGSGPTQRPCHDRLGRPGHERGAGREGESERDKCEGSAGVREGTTERAHSAR
jgi:hypothetical protein